MDQQFSIFQPHLDYNNVELNIEPLLKQNDDEISNIDLLYYDKNNIELSNQHHSDSKMHFTHLYSNKFVDENKNISDDIDVDGIMNNEYSLMSFELAPIDMNERRQQNQIEQDANLIKYDLKYQDNDIFHDGDDMLEYRNRDLNIEDNTFFSDSNNILGRNETNFVDLNNLKKHSELSTLAHY